jgi:ribosome maturation factor RimP
MWSGKAKEMFEKLEPLANSMGLKIVEMDIPIGNNGVFRVYVDNLDKSSKVTIEACSKLSPIVSDFMDTEDVFPFRYYLEISSPGLDRPVRRWEDIKDVIGETLKIKLSVAVDGRKRIKGKLVSADYENGTFTVECDGDGKEITIKKEFVKKINTIWNGEK